MDALSDVLRSARLSGGVFLHAEFTEPWCISTRVTPQFCLPFLGQITHLVPYHYIVEGHLRVALEGREPEELQSGDVVLFPYNDMHLMGSDLALPPVRGRDVIQISRDGGLHTIRHGGGGGVTRMICGYLGADTAAFGNPALTNLPRTMKLRIDETGLAEWIRSTFHYAASEGSQDRLGSETVLAKLSELLFVEAVRRYVQDLPVEQTGWLAGLRDPVVSRALALMHGDIARPWNVEDLGRETGSSRSTLAERFTRFIGMAPMHYLAQWRMQAAAQKLRDTTASLAQVANAVGYESEAAFSRAFKKQFGRAPATWRRTPA